MAHEGAATLELEIVTPDGLALRKTGVDEVSAPSVAGRFGVLPGHVPVVASLQTGIVTWKQAGQEESCAVGSGFVEVSNHQIRILTDCYQAKETVDPVRVRAALKDVEEEILRSTDDPTSPAFQELVARELWCAAQLELYGDPPPPTLHFASPYGSASEPEQIGEENQIFPTSAA